jgi:hypothetical protein
VVQALQVAMAVKELEIVLKVDMAQLILAVAVDTELVALVS